MQNFWDTAKSVIKRKCIALSTFIRREERLKNKWPKHSNQEVGKTAEEQTHDSMSHEGNIVKEGNKCQREFLK